jgi:hypothetical protein
MRPYPFEHDLVPKGISLFGIMLWSGQDSPAPHDSKNTSKHGKGEAVRKNVKWTVIVPSCIPFRRQQAL